ncbi:hypothetical protein ACHHYP_01999 [Achlya hypogyna]|uniref:PUB domain-containing protein n=1 Tax=Achlya hypogyna TaxID=1202772 RepID=A0A1V9Z7K1_ACHHY|nr:hypothetical protein ACHHYP_01999 [Achlya hypogyna]
MELKRLTGAIEDAEMRLRELVASRAANNTTEEAAVQQRASLHVLMGLMEATIAPGIDKFLERLAWTDPVTGDPRYGPVMQDKIRALHVRVETLRTELEAVAAPVESDGAAVQAQLEQRLREEQAAAESRAEQERVVAAAAEAAAHELERQRAEAEATVIAQEHARLAAAAQKVREERSRQQAEDDARAAAEREALLELHKRTVVGLEGLRPAMSTLRAAVAALPDCRSRWPQALATLHTFLKHICSAPENPVYRQIKESNVHFVDAVGQYPGARDVLLAMGFVLQYQEGGGVYIMEEPDLAADMDKWSDWFETLKAMRDYVESLGSQPLNTGAS